MDPSKQTPHSTPVIGSRLKALSREFEGPDNRHSSKKIPKKSFTNPRLIPEGTPVNSLFQNLMPQRASPISSNSLTSRTPKTADSSFQYSDEIIREAVNIFKNSVGGPVDPYFVEKMAKKPSEITQLLTVANPNQSNQISQPLGHKRYSTNFPQRSIPLHNHYGHNILYHSSWQPTFKPNEGNPVDHIGRTLYFEDTDKKVHKIPPEISPYHPMQRANFRNERANHVGLGNMSNGIQGQINDLLPQVNQNPTNNGLSDRNSKDDTVNQTEKSEQLIHTDAIKLLSENDKKLSPENPIKIEKSDVKPKPKIEVPTDTQIKAPESSMPPFNYDVALDISKEEPGPEPEPESASKPSQPYYGLINRDILKSKNSGSEALIKYYLEIQKTSEEDGRLENDMGIFALQSSLNYLNSKLPHKSLDLLTTNGGKMQEAARDSFIQNIKSQGNDIIFDKSSGVGKWKIHPTNIKKSPVSKPISVKTEEKTNKPINNEDIANEVSQRKQSPDSDKGEVRTDRGAKQTQVLRQHSLKPKPNKPSPVIKLSSNNAPINIKQEAKPEVKFEKQLDNISLLAQNTILKPIPTVKSSISKNDSNIFEAPSKADDIQKSNISKKNIVSSEKPKSINPSKVKSVPMPPSDASVNSLGVKKSSKTNMKSTISGNQAAPMKKIMVTITLPSQRQIDFQNRCFNKLQKVQKLKSAGTKPLNSKEKRVLAQSNHDDYLSTSPEYKDSRSKFAQKRAREDDQISPNIDQDISKQTTNREASKTLAKPQRRNSKQHLSPITTSQPHKEDNTKPPVPKTARASPSPSQLHSSSMTTKIDTTSTKATREIEERSSNSQPKTSTQRQQNTSSQNPPSGVIPTTTPREMTDSLKSKISKYSEIAKAWKNKAQKVVNDQTTTEFQKKQALATYVECSLMFIHNSDINDYTQEFDPSRQWMSIATMLEQAAKYLKFYDGGCLYGLANILCAMSYSSIAYYYNKKVDPSNPSAQNEGILKNVANYYTKSGMSLSAGIAALNTETLTNELPATMAKCKGGEIEFPHELVYFKWVSVIRFAQSVVDEYILNNKMQSIRGGQ